MTIIVRHKRTGRAYILLSVNSGDSKVNLPSRLLNDFFTQEPRESNFLVTLCDSQGKIIISPIDDLIVTEIEGKKLTELLPQENYSSVADELDDEFEEDFETENSKAETIITPPPSNQKKDNDNFDQDDEDWI